MVLWSSIAFLVLAASPTGRISPCPKALSDTELARPMNEQERREVIHALADMAEALYVDRAKGKLLAASLRRDGSGRRYSHHVDAIAFADAVTSDMRAVVADKHLKLRRQRIEPAAASAPLDTPEAKAARLERFRRGAAYDGYGIREVKVMPGNIGYVSFGEFWTPKVAAAAIDGAMTVLRDSDALIIDLRDSYGGSEEMVQHLAGYLLPDSTVMFQSIDHLSGESRTGSSTPRQASERLRPNIPVFVLTSKRKTFSAAEMLALALQRKRGATIVGEQTRGGANGGDFRPLSCRFDAFIPYYSSTVDGRNWEGVGIKPDVSTPEATASNEAYRLALRKLLETPLTENADGLAREIREERIEMLAKAESSPGK